MIYSPPSLLFVDINWAVFRHGRVFKVNILNKLSDYLVICSLEVYLSAGEFTQLNESFQFYFTDQSFERKELTHYFELIDAVYLNDGSCIYGILTKRFLVGYDYIFIHILNDFNSFEFFFFAFFPSLEQ